MQGKSGMKEPVINSDKAGRTACPPGANSALWTSFLYTRDIASPSSCCSGKGDVKKGNKRNKDGKNIEKLNSV